MGMGGNVRVYEARPIVISPDDLPRDFVAYDPLDAVVINEAPLSQLTEEQAQALRLWVASGGLLIVAGGADFSGMRASRLDELLPVEPSSAAVSGYSFADANQIYGPFENPEATPGVTARLKPGARSLLGPADHPLVAERDFGNGLVRFVAVNPKLNPYRAWNGAKEMWADLLWPSAESKPHHTNWITGGSRGPGRAGRFGIQDFLFHLAEVQPPSAKYVLFFLLAYVLLVGPINYVILRWRRKTDLAWLTIPAVVVLFTMVSVTVAQMSHGGKSVIADASLVTVHQADGIADVSNGLIVVPSAKDVQELSFPGSGVYVADVFNGNQGGTSADGAIEFRRDPKEYTVKAPLAERMASLFQSRAVYDKQPPIVAVRGGGATVSIKNTGNAQISRAVYLSPDGASDVFDLAPGAEEKIALSTPPAQSFNVWYGQLIGSGDETELFQDVASALDREVGGDRAISNSFFESQMMSDALKRLSHPILIGFIEKAPSEIGFRSAYKRTSKSLYVIFP
jgi:hypothetical protein